MVSVRLRVLLVLFFVFGLLSILFNWIGPSADEGIYIIAGLELLDGGPDSYSNWHNGSPYFWALISGWIYSHSSLQVVRIFTLLLSTGIVYLQFLHCKFFFSEKEATYSVLLILLFAPFFSFAQIAVYDVFAFFFFMLSTVIIQKKHLLYLIVAGVLSGLAIVTKYAFIIFFPILLLFILLRDYKNKILTLGVFSISAGIVVIIHNLIVFNSFIPTSYSSYEATKIGYNLVDSLGITSFIVFPLLLIMVFNKKELGLQKKWIYLFLVGLSIWPLFHLVTGNPTSAQKHIIYGIVFSIPLFVLPFKNLLLNYKKPFIITSSLLFIVQFFFLGNSWSNIAPANTKLFDVVSINSTIVSTAGTYRTRYFLFEQLENSSSQIFNFHQLTNSQLENTSNYEFFLLKKTNDSKIEKWLEKNKTSFTPVLTYSDWFVGAEDHLSYGIHNLEMTLYRNTNYKP